jgi:hypothetical protein
VHPIYWAQHRHGGILEYFKKVIVGATFPIQWSSVHSYNLAIFQGPLKFTDDPLLHDFVLISGAIALLSVPMSAPHVCLIQAFMQYQYIP